MPPTACGSGWWLGKPPQTQLIGCAIPLFLYGALLILQYVYIYIYVYACTYVSHAYTYIKWLHTADTSTDGSSMKKSPTWRAAPFLR